MESLSMRRKRKLVELKKDTEAYAEHLAKQARRREKMRDTEEERAAARRQAKSQKYNTNFRVVPWL
jgi:hypothetical protein